MLVYERQQERRKQNKWEGRRGCRPAQGHVEEGDRQGREGAGHQPLWRVDSGPKPKSQLCCTSSWLAGDKRTGY